MRFEVLARVLEQMSAIPVDDERRFREAYSADWSSVFRFAVAWTNDLGAAEELAQEAFMRLWVRRGSIDWTRPALPWLLVVTRRLATDRFRRLRRPITSPRVRDINAGLDGWLDVRSAFGRLSAEERAALVTVAILGFSSAEAAELMGISAGAVRAAVSRARSKLEAER